MSDNRPNWVHQAHLRLQRSALGCNVDGLATKIRKGTKWSPPPLSLRAAYNMMPDAYRATFCEHGKMWIEQCNGCKRSRKEAKLNLLRFAKLSR